MNPAVTLTFYRLGKVAIVDGIGYIAAQVVGGVSGGLVATAALGMLLADPAVNYVATVPGMAGSALAWLAEFAISGLLILAVLTVSNSPLARYTGVCAGVLVMLFIIVEAPLSGMSMNPARTLSSALPSGAWDDLWIYLSAPPLGMLFGAEVVVRTRGYSAALCAKLVHPRSGPCLFRCAYAPSPASQPGSGARCDQR
jgi:aquaporin Z